MKEYSPTYSQRMAKSRLYKWLGTHEARVRLEDMTVSAISAAAKAPQMNEWLSKSSEFADWLYERDTISTKVHAYSEIALDRLYNIVSDETSETGDIIKAAKLLLELADAFPKKGGSVVFADKALNEMSDDQVQKELEAYKAKLSIGGAHGNS
jgi:hypothetical protein